MKINNDLLTPEDAAEVLEVSTRWVQKLCQAGRLGSWFSGRWVISPLELAEFAAIPRKIGHPTKKLSVRNSN